MTTFIAITQDDQGNIIHAPFTAASTAAAETAIDNALKAQLATGLPTNPATGKPDVRIAVQAAAKNAAAPPANGALILLLQVVGATQVTSNATPAAPNSGWTT